MGIGHQDLQAYILGRECVAKYHRGRGTGWAIQGETSAELIYFLFSDFLIFLFGIHSTNVPAGTCQVSFSARAGSSCSVCTPVTQLGRTVPSLWEA